MAPVESLELAYENTRWRGHWWMFCGHCSLTDIASCCTAYNLPCVAYGCAASKAFRTSFWREVGKFLLVLMLPGLITAILAGSEAAFCHATDADPASSDSPASSASTALVLSTQCILLAIAVRLAQVGTFVCAIVWAWYIGGPRRTQMRKLLGIADTGAGGDCCTCGVAGPLKGARSDACLHFWCLWCAVAQEMRTVMHLQADDKLPKQFIEGYEPLPSKPPAVDGKMTRGKPEGGAGIV